MRFFYAYTLIVLGLFASACNSDEPSEEEQPDYAALIIGDWETQAGMQNGEASDRLMGFAFSFTKENMQTEMLEPMIGAQQATYKIEGDRIVLEGQPGVDFTIKKLNEDSLRIAFEARESAFDFILTRGKEETTVSKQSDSTTKTEETPQ